MLTLLLVSANDLTHHQAMPHHTHAPLGADAVCRAKRGG
jgi:hypothetical protein